MAMADFQSEVANAFQYLNPINWIKPKQSREGMLLESYVKGGILRPERIGELLTKQKEGASSAQILQEITAAPDQYFVKTEEERQISLLQVKALMEQQAEERRQGQSKQMGGIMEQFRQPFAQIPQQMFQGLSQIPGQQQLMPVPGIPQTIPQSGLSMFSPRLSMPQSMSQIPSPQAPGSISQGGLPQEQALSLPQQNMPSQGQPSALDAMIAMWNAGHGPTEPEKLADIIQKLLPTFSPAEQRQVMENQALQGLQPGSKQYGQTFLKDVYPSTQQEESLKLDREKFEQSKNPPRTLEEKYKDYLAEQSMTRFSDLTSEQQDRELFIHAFPDDKVLSFKDQQVKDNWDKLSSEQRLEYTYGKAAKPKTEKEKWEETKARERSTGFPSLPKEAKQRELYPSAYRPTEGTSVTDWNQFLANEKKTEYSKLTPEEQKKIKFPALKTSTGVGKTSIPIQIKTIPDQIRKEFNEEKTKLAEEKKKEDRRIINREEEGSGTLRKKLKENEDNYKKDLKNAFDMIISSKFQTIRNAGEDPNKIIGNVVKDIVKDFEWDIILEKSNNDYKSWPGLL